VHWPEKFCSKIFIDNFGNLTSCAEQKSFRGKQQCLPKCQQISEEMLYFECI